MNRDNIHENINQLTTKIIFLLRNEKWKKVRKIVVSTLTTARLRLICEMLNECCNELSLILVKKAERNGSETEIETHDVFSRAVTDGMSLATFGKSDCVKNKESQVYKIAVESDKVFKNPRNMLLYAIFPKIYSFFGFQLMTKKVTDFFVIDIINEMNRRREGNISRSDILQLLMEAKENLLKVSRNKVDDLNFTDEELVAQIMAVFIGGLETSTTLLQSICFELSMNSEIQKTLAEEVDEMLESLDNKAISYSELNSMKYLEMIVNETLRKWSPIKVIKRSANKDYELVDEETGKSYFIKEDTDIIIPIAQIHMNPKYFPDPTTFDPDRFSYENMGKIKSGTFVPFGLGPRNCFGMRLGYLQTKLIIFSIVSKFHIEKSEKTPKKLIHSTGMTGFTENIFVNLTLRK